MSRAGIAATVVAAIGAGVWITREERNKHYTNEANQKILSGRDKYLKGTVSGPDPTSPDPNLDWNLTGEFQAAERDLDRAIQVQTAADKVSGVTVEGKAAVIPSNTSCRKENCV